eukprot:jgi/Mesvir1/15692/Mv03283-RA.1
MSASAKWQVCDCRLSASVTWGHASNCLIAQDSYSYHVNVGSRDFLSTWKLSMEFVRRLEAKPHRSRKHQVPVALRSGFVGKIAARRTLFPSRPVSSPICHCSLPSRGNDGAHGNSSSGGGGGGPVNVPPGSTNASNVHASSAGVNASHATASGSATTTSGGSNVANSANASGASTGGSSGPSSGVGGGSGGGGGASSNPVPQLPPHTAPLYAHSLPGIEHWLRNLQFVQDESDPSRWRISREDWSADLQMDTTDLVIRYHSRPGTTPKDVERKFSYALSRQDLENAVLNGP